MRLVIAVVLLLVGPARADVLGVGDKLAEFDVAVDRAGKPVKLAAYRGRWVLITIGAAWCGPCQKELPTWDQIAGDFAGRITFIALSIDDDIPDGIAFHDRLKLRSMTRVYLPQATSAMTARYGADKMPSTVIADPSGVVRYAHGGFEARDAAGEAKKLRAILVALLPAKPAPKPVPPKPTPEPPKPAPRTGLALHLPAPPSPWTTMLLHF